MRRAWGNTTNRRLWNGESPRTAAASVCVGGIACNPPRTVLGDVCRSEKRESDHGSQHPVQLQPGRQKQRDEQLSEEQHGDQWHRPHYFDVSAAGQTQHRQVAATTESQQNTRRETQHGAADRQQQREAEATPLTGGHRLKTQAPGEQHHPQRNHQAPECRKSLTQQARRGPTNVTGGHQDQQSNYTSGRQR